VTEQQSPSEAPFHAHRNVAVHIVLSIARLPVIVMLPMSIVVFGHPDAARGMPFWAFLLMSLGFVAFALGYALLTDWITPPGAEDPFERYRRRDR
jgi:hypothetical protein